MEQHNFLTKMQNETTTKPANFCAGRGTHGGFELKEKN